MDEPLLDQDSDGLEDEVLGVGVRALEGDDGVDDLADRERLTEDEPHGSHCGLDGVDGGPLEDDERPVVVEGVRPRSPHDARADAEVLAQQVVVGAWRHRIAPRLLCGRWEMDPPRLDRRRLGEVLAEQVDALVDLGVAQLGRRPTCRRGPGEAVQPLLDEPERGGLRDEVEEVLREVDLDDLRSSGLGVASQPEQRGEADGRRRGVSGAWSPTR